MKYEQDEHEELEQLRFKKLEESIHNNYRLVLAIGVGILAGCIVYAALGASPKECAWIVIAGMLCVEIETIYENKRRAKQ